MKVIHFRNQRERLDFVRGKFTEIKPIEVKKAKKAKKKGKEEDAVQAD